MYFLCDYRGVELYHPTFLYAYGALILQCGVVQTIGCLGAQRLSHKLLSLYWSLLLLLTLGDIGVGLYWVIHLEKIKVNLRPYLSREFIERYSTDEAFTLRWNKIQSQDRCCGVDGPFDFDRFPVSHQSKQAAFSANSHVIVDVETGLLSLPESCCTLLYAPATVSSSSSSGTSVDKTYRVSHYPPEEEHPPFNDQSPEPTITANDEHFNHHPRDFAGGGRRGGGRRSSRTAVSLPHKNDEPRMIRFSTNEQEEIGEPAVIFETDDEDDEGDDNDDSGERKQYLGGFLQDSNNNETPYYLNYFHQSHGQQLAVVPDDHDVEHHREQQPAEHNHQSAESSLQKRDIKTYEPIHAHKVRHELHRKSQSSPLIDVKLLKNITYSLVVDRYRNLTDENFEYNSNNVSSSSSGESSINKSSRWYDGNLPGNETRDISSKSHIRKARKVGEVVALVPDVVDVHHGRQSRTNKTNKLFPSISFRVKSERRETRALSSSVTQVPTLSSTPPIQRHKACHGQPEGLNHHNSYKKDLPDQRKTTKNKKGAGAKTSSPTAKILGAAWVHRKTTRTSASPTASAIPTTSASQIAMEFTSADITEKMKTSKIGILQKRHGSSEGGGGRDRNTETDQESLLAKRDSPSTFFTDASSFSSPPNSSKLTSSPFQKSKKSTTRRNVQSTTTLHERHLMERRQKRQKRVVDTSADSSTDSTQHQQSDSLAISQSSPLTSNDKGRAVEMSRNPNSFTDPYFFPVSSSSLSSSSSTSYLEAQSPQAAIISSSSTPYESNREWNEWSESNNNAYKGNTSDNEENSGKNNGNSSSAGQKKLYVYGVGCGVKLIEWVDRVSGILFILGFCIIGFVKTCFLVILRTEIREMIEKIHMIEPEEILSPSRTHSTKDRQSFHFIPHPLLQNPHRASTVSAHGLLLPTIKSPDGPTSMGMAPSVSGGSYNRQNRHYLRRASNIVGGDRSRSHSNETVNMSLLMTTSQGVEKGRSNPTLPTSTGGSSGTIANLEEKDPVSGLSITVPNSSSSTGGMGTNSSTFGASRYLRRSSTCSSSANPVGYPYSGFETFEPRPGPSSRFYQYFEPVYQTPHLYQQHHHHHYTRNRSHSRNMSCGAILPLASYRTSSAAAAASAALAASYRGNRNLSSATTATTTTTSNIPNSTGCSFSSTSKDETEMIISVSLEQIASSDQDEEAAIPEEEAPFTSILATTIDEEDVKDQEKKNWAAATACSDDSDNIKSTSKVEDNADTKLQTYSYSESANESGSSSSAGAGGGGGSERDFQRRNGNNNVDLTNALPMSYIGTAV